MKIHLKDKTVECSYEEGVKIIEKLLLDKCQAITTLSSSSVGMNELGTPKKHFKDGRPKKISLETIKQIKRMAYEDNKKDGEIAKLLNLSSQEVHYWRKNTPKELT